MMHDNFCVYQECYNTEIAFSPALVTATVAAADASGAVGTPIFEKENEESMFSCHGIMSVCVLNYPAMGR
jgi:hypothetical protein